MVITTLEVVYEKLFMTGFSKDFLQEFVKRLVVLG